MQAKYVIMGLDDNQERGHEKNAVLVTHVDYSIVIVIKESFAWE